MYSMFTVLAGLLFFADTAYIVPRSPDFQLENRPSVKVPKSIFAVPLLERCSNGYVHHGEKGCLRLITVDEQTQTQNLLMRLSYVFAGYQQRSNEQEKEQRSQVHEQERQQQLQQQKEREQQNTEKGRQQNETEHQQQQKKEHPGKEKMENKEQCQREKQEEIEQRERKENEHPEKTEKEPQQKEMENQEKEQQQNRGKGRKQKNQPEKEQQQQTDIEQRDDNKTEEVHKTKEQQQQQHDEREQKNKNGPEAEPNLMQLTTRRTLSQYYQYGVYNVKTEDHLLDFVGILGNSTSTLATVAPATYAPWEHHKTTTTMNFPLRIQIPLRRRNRGRKKRPKNI